MLMIMERRQYIPSSRRKLRSLRVLLPGLNDLMFPFCYDFSDFILNCDYCEAINVTHISFFNCKDLFV